MPDIATIFPSTFVLKLSRHVPPISGSCLHLMIPANRLLITRRDLLRPLWAPLSSRLLQRLASPGKRALALALGMSTITSLLLWGRWLLDVIISDGTFAAVDGLVVVFWVGVFGDDVPGVQKARDEAESTE